jgi:hypothetical protein
MEINKLETNDKVLAGIWSFIELTRDSCITIFLLMRDIDLHFGLTYLVPALPLSTNKIIWH